MFVVILYRRIAVALQLAIGLPVFIRVFCYLPYSVGLKNM